MNMNDHPENVKKRPLLVRVFRWLFSWRIIRRMLITLAGLITLLALFITEENWRGKRAWENYKREWEAKGEKFDWHAFVPPSVPDDQNFFTTSFFTNLLKSETAMSLAWSEGSYPTNRPGYWAKSTVTDLKPWQTYYRTPPKTNYANKFLVAAQPQTPAADVLLALGIYDSAIEELRQASQRPYSNLPLNYENGFNAVAPLFKYLAGLKRCSQVLRLRAIAELADGQNAKALDDVKLLLRLNDSIRNQPFLISHLVRIAMMDIALQPIWEGFAGHTWSDEQLAALDAELEKLDFLADYQFTMRGERAFAIASFENQRLTRKMIVPQDNGENKPLTVSMRFMPSAFFYQNELAFAQMHQQWSLSLVNMETRIVSPEALRRVDAEVGAANKHYSPYKVLARMLNPAIRAAVIKFAIIQGQVDLAHVGCALERYRLAHGNYPESLDALAPQFIAKIPHDIINGQPLHYRRTDDGKFMLYSIGWNATDDGGVVGLRKTGTVDFGQGDWVWQYPD
jgi:hypothetical protein